MPSTPYPFLEDLPAALQRAKERVRSPAEMDAYLMELLQLSAGTLLATDPTTGEQVSQVAYRPYYVAAVYLEQDLVSQRISEAKNVKFTGYDKPIESLYCQQSAADIRFGLDVPDSYKAICESAGAAGAGAAGAAGAGAGTGAAGGSHVLPGGSVYPATTTYGKRVVF